MYGKLSSILAFVAWGILSWSVSIEAQQAPQPEIPASLELENGLYQGAIDILDQLRELDSSIRNVGALKFVIVHEGAKHPPRSLGQLNMRLAEKLETALVWASPKSNKGLKQSFGVIKNASQIAADIGLNHLEKSKARGKFFEVNRPLYWQNENSEVEAKADAIVFGFASLSGDLSEIKIELSAFSKIQPEVEIQSKSFTAKLELSDLLDGGMSFSSRGQGQPQVVKFHRPSLHPLEAGPLKLDVYYGDVVGTSADVRWDKQPQKMTQIVDPDSKVCEMMIPEPKVGRRMRLVVRRRDDSDQTKRYGVVLKVNGANSLYSQTLPNERCAAWVLEPNKKQFSISGFQTKIGADGKRQPFTSFGGQHADEIKRFYGSDTGLISMTVFKELSKEQLKIALDDSKEVLHSIERSIAPKEAMANRSSLTAKYRSQLFPSDPRGIISKGKEELGKTMDPVSFRRDPTPVLSGSLRYFRD